VLALSLALIQSSAAQNPIPRENENAGTRDWLLTKTDVDENHRSRAIEGFCSHLSIRAGETLRIYVSMNPPGEFTLDVFRMGYYGGDGATYKLTGAGPHRGATQPDAEAGDRNVYECKWEPSLRIDIPEGWTSGVYLGKLTAVGSGVQSYVVFIVRDERNADFLFQCSDFTWQAYNRWPAWASLYDYEGNRWETEQSNDVSLDRPYSRYYNGLPARIDDVTQYIGSGEFLLWEFPLAYWMEQHGYDVTYISNLDTHVGGERLHRAKGFLSVGHDEYWTDQMIENVAGLRDAGVNLAFFSGNAISFAIALANSHDGRPNRVFRREHDLETEQDLMGAASYGVGLADWTCRKPDNWVFAGTGLEDGEAIEGLVGWEFHGPPLAEHASLEVLARGRVHEPSGDEKPEVYAAVIYDGPRDNFVFNAATCWWSLPLATPPGAFYPNNARFGRDDHRVRQITHNVLKRMIGE
jgi:hypothetical protein